MQKRLTTVLMTDEECALFILFQKHYDNIAYLISQGVFDIKEGNAKLSFNQNGECLSIEKQLFNHRKRLSPVQEEKGLHFTEIVL